MVVDYPTPEQVVLALGDQSLLVSCWQRLSMTGDAVTERREYLYCRRFPGHHQHSEMLLSPLAEARQACTALMREKTGLKRILIR